MNTFRTKEVPKGTKRKITFRDIEGAYVSIDRAIIIEKKIMVSADNDVMTGYVRFSLKGPSRDILVLVEPYNSGELLFPELNRLALCSQLEKL